SLVLPLTVYDITPYNPTLAKSRASPPKKLESRATMASVLRTSLTRASTVRIQSVGMLGLKLVRTFRAESAMDDGSPALRTIKMTLAIDSWEVWAKGM